MERMRIFPYKLSHAEGNKMCENFCGTLRKEQKIIIKERLYFVFPRIGLGLKISMHFQLFILIRMVISCTKHALFFGEFAPLFIIVCFKQKRTFFAFFFLRKLTLNMKKCCEGKKVLSKFN